MKTIKMSCSHALIKYLTVQKIMINGKTMSIYYVDFLCVHKDYRGKNLATFLISLSGTFIFSLKAFTPSITSSEFFR